MDGIQGRQASMLKEHGEWMQEHDKAIAESVQRGKALDERIEKLVIAIGKRVSSRS
jgi:hypothetical protein